MSLLSGKSNFQQSIALDYGLCALVKRCKGYYILILNYETKRLRIAYFSPSDVEKANTVYSQIENNHQSATSDAVLVRASSFQTLKNAYPNYFLDIGEFVDIVSEYLS